MSDHTPLPWKIIMQQVQTSPEQYKRTGQAWEDTDIPMRIEGTDRFSPCELGRDGWKNKGTTKANAELIVRAVNSYDDLLEACEQVLENRHEHRFHETYDAFDESAELLKQAIAKATKSQ